MIAKPVYPFLFLCLLSVSLIHGQGVSFDTVRIPSTYKPEFRRAINHDAIDNEQKSILASDGKQDKVFTPSKDEEINFRITKVLVSNVDVLQYQLETDKGFDTRLKVNYLKGLENILKYFRANWKSRSDRKINPLNLPLIINAYVECVARDRRNESIESIIKALPYDAGTVIVNANIFDKNEGLKAAKNELILKYCILKPQQTFQTLKENPDLPFADSLIRLVATRYPRQLYDYAAASNKLGWIIRNITDDIFIQSISRMARDRSGQQYFPFLDNIVKGKMTFDEIAAVKDDSIQYYKLLVKTHMDYVARAMNKDTAYEFKALSDKMAGKARDVFVNTINGLHDETAEVRFRIIQPLTAEELYYLAVSTDGIIYTSSYVKGVYPLMMKKVNNRGDSLLLKLNFDKYRKFIKMAAGYNMLSNFLSTFSPRRTPEEESDAEKLMKAFVGRLEIGGGLEDGVDVADSYASIVESIKPLSNEMLNNIQINYQRNQGANNKRGIVMYNILNNLFLSADSTNKIDLTKELGIPPIYEVPFSSMVNDSGRVYMHVFFYGDKDGQGIFPGFLNMFSNPNWKIDRSNEFWVSISSVKGKPVTIFANKPLPEEGGFDEKAQEALREYMELNKFYPSITIHRGHSYYAESTIAQMFSSSKIVFLGSCGGFHLIHKVLEKAPDAHIIATKQIADVPVNKPFFQLLTDKIRNGNNIDWIPFWKELDDMVTDKIFEDYVPPYKNLGALFIKAYKIAMETEEEKMAGTK